MKTIKIFMMSGALAITTFITTSFINLKPVYKSAINKVAAPGFAVVELYTSEGCSSCPPADELVAKIQKEVTDQPVYILAFHVDYWNRLGWKDVFSDAAYSKRQGDYARYLKIESVYTPQIVVNGKKEFVGSEEGTLRNAIKGALQSQPAAKIVLSDVKTMGRQATIHYDVDGNTGNTTLLFALVEKAARTMVKAGENSGRALSHVQIVRNLQSINLNKGKNGVSNVTLPNGINTGNYEIIALLQNTITGEISAAAKTALPPVAI
ncbi:MAG: DUF1223 domain-containing protein [Mucilaginibacter sp.]